MTCKLRLSGICALSVAAMVLSGCKHGSAPKSFEVWIDKEQFVCGQKRGDVLSGCKAEHPKTRTEIESFPPAVFWGDVGGGAMFVGESGRATKPSGKDITEIPVTSWANRCSRDHSGGPKYGVLVIEEYDGVTIPSPQYLNGGITFESASSFPLAIVTVSGPLDFTELAKWTFQIGNRSYTLTGQELADSVKESVVEQVWGYCDDPTGCMLTSKKDGVPEPVYLDRKAESPMPNPFPIVPCNHRWSVFAKKPVNITITSVPLSLYAAGEKR